jgi:hypothetical protein
MSAKLTELTVLSGSMSATDYIYIVSGGDSWKCLASQIRITASQISNSTAIGQALMVAANTAAARTAIACVIGTDVQAYNANLASLAGLTLAADKLLYATAVSTIATATLTTFARTILDDADATAARATLLLGTFAVEAVSAVPSLTFADAADVAVNTGTGTKIGTAVGQKLGFWNATPVIQQASATQAVVATSGAGSLDGADTVDKAVLLAKVQAIEVLLNRLRLDLVTTGMIKGAA